MFTDIDGKDVEVSFLFERIIFEFQCSTTNKPDLRWQVNDSERILFQVSSNVGLIKTAENGIIYANLTEKEIDPELGIANMTSILFYDGTSRVVITCGSSGSSDTVFFGEYM